MARARILAQAADWAGALDAYSTAVAGLPQMAWGGLNFDDQLNVLSNTSQTVSDAAAVALEAGAPERALELLEHGRGLLLSYALDMRTDLETIRRRAPELAADLALSRNERTSGRVRGSDDASVRRRQSQRRWDRLVEQARRQPGLADFLKPLPYLELLDTSRHGPVVVLNSSSLRTDALILHDGQLKVGPLPLFRHDKAVLRADALTRSVHRAGTREREEFLERRPYLTDVLDWLWTAGAEPILRVLPRYPARDADTAPPRLWLCPTGVFNRLPVHAATRLPDPCEPDDRGADSFADRFVVSHTPTLRALRAAREEADRVSHRTTSPVLLVGVGKEPPYTGLPALGHVALEINAVARLLPAARDLRDEEAIRDAVVQQLRGGGWLHFAGHGTVSSITSTASSSCSCSMAKLRRSSRTASASHFALDSRCCRPYGLASPACSASVQQFLRGRSDNSPSTNSRARRRGSTRVNRPAMRPIRASNMSCQRAGSML